VKNVSALEQKSFQPSRCDGGICGILENIFHRFFEVICEIFKFFRMPGLASACRQKSFEKVSVFRLKCSTSLFPSSKKLEEFL
jgi:hypothetical protein